MQRQSNQAGHVITQRDLTIFTGAAVGPTTSVAATGRDTTRVITQSTGDRGQRQAATAETDASAITDIETSVMAVVPPRITAGVIASVRRGVLLTHNGW